MISMQSEDKFKILEKSGFYDDDWCAPEAWIRLKTENFAFAASCTIWTKSEIGSPRTCRLAIQVDRDEPFVCNIDVDKPHEIIFAVRRPLGSMFNLSFLCDRQIKNKDHDIRNISFKLENLKLYS